MALAAIRGGGVSRLGYARRIAIVSGVANLVRVLGFVAQAAAEGAWLERFFEQRESGGLGALETGRVEMTVVEHRHKSTRCSLPCGCG